MATTVSNSGYAGCRGRSATTSFGRSSKCSCRLNSPGTPRRGEQMEAASRRSRLTEGEGKQIAVRRLAPSLAREPVEERRFRELRIEPPPAPVVAHMRTQLRKRLLLERLARQLALRLALLLVERPRLLAPVGRILAEQASLQVVGGSDRSRLAAARRRQYLHRRRIALLQRVLE